MKLASSAGVAPRRVASLRLLAAVATTTFVAGYYWPWPIPRPPTNPSSIPAQCLALDTPLTPPPSLIASRSSYSGVSDRFVPGTRATLIRNAKILTGARNGTEVVFGDVLLDGGLVRAVGYVPSALIDASVDVIDAEGRWVSPGLVDAHSHLGVYSAPALNGASDGNSIKAPILPWLRSVDGLNTHDEAYRLAIAGGVTTAQILPGSANSIGGQAFLMKLRPTAERSSSSMLLEPPHTLFLNSSADARPRYRHMKHACGENPMRTYDQTRMDNAWGFRQAYDTARQLKDKQDVFCAKAKAGSLSAAESAAGFPEDLQWEALVDVLRGRVKVSVHCYEAVDLDMLVRLTNEFQFPVASIHHAGETYLVPDLLKRAWGNLPAIAIFASNARKKREAYRASEFAARIMSDNGLPVIMKSDHPVLNSRYLLYEAQQAHYYSFHQALAIASVTSTPADALGVGWRVGRVQVGYDADLVIWDSHPLSLGATPSQVWIDGIPQLSPSLAAKKPDSFQHVPKTPSWEKEIKQTIEWEGLPLLEPPSPTAATVVFVGVSDAWIRSPDVVGIEALVPNLNDGQDNAAGAPSRNLTVVIHAGNVVCAGLASDGACASFFQSPDANTKIIDLEGGTLFPGLTTFGSDLGLSEILLEPSTRDGVVTDPLTGSVPDILGGRMVRAVDGLQFGGRNTLLAYRAGVTTGIVAPIGRGFLHGIGTAFSTSAKHALDRGAVLRDETAVHVSLHMGMRGASVSTQVAALRRSLFGAGDAWARVRAGEIPLVVNVDSADIMATLIQLKAEFEGVKGTRLQITFAGAAEAHLLAREIGEAGVSVVLSPARPYPEDWNSRRILPGPPLSDETAPMKLLRHGVNVGLGVPADYDARNARFEMAWAALDANDTIDYATALALVSTNIDKALGLRRDAAQELVVLQGGGLFDLESKVIGIVSPRGGAVDLF
ncbi:Composite domain of metallo-dependent hydrolase [Mycena kentingensis (nom. inval.)]|nr:Composite domain of metallo-dependent hydrolase [Mycena kentingensis (nom. inval.)]